MLEDSFKSEIDFWEVDVLNLSQEFSLEIKFPPEKRVKSAKFVKENDPDKVMNIQPILMRDYNRDKILLQVMNFDKNERYKIEWAYF